MIVKHGTFTMTRDEANVCKIVADGYHYNNEDYNDFVEEVLVRARDDINIALRKHRRGKLKITQDVN